jgi:hypothetical protein
VIFAIAGFALGVYILYRIALDPFGRLRGDDILLIIVFSPLYGVLFGMLATALAHAFFGWLPQEWVLTETTPIASLNTVMAAEGSVFLGSGIIDGEEYYTYSYPVGEHRYRRGKLRVSRTTVHEMRSGAPRIERFEQTHAKDWFWLLNPIVPGAVRYEVYVPVASVKKQFRIF